MPGQLRTQLLAFLKQLRTHRSLTRPGGGAGQPSPTLLCYRGHHSYPSCPPGSPPLSVAASAAALASAFAALAASFLACSFSALARFASRALSRFALMRGSL